VTVGILVSQPGNRQRDAAGHRGRYQQHLTFLPERWPGSVCPQITAPRRRSRTESRCGLTTGAGQAPNSWNVSPDDAAADVVRLGVSYNGPNIYAYQYQNVNSDGTPIAAADPTLAHNGTGRGQPPHTHRRSTRRPRSASTTPCQWLCPD
jgi:hypothetical protein